MGTGRHTGQNLAKSVPAPHVEKIELKNFPFPSDNIKYPTAQPNDRQKQVELQTLKLWTGKRLNYPVDRSPACNRRLAQWRVMWLIEHSTSHQLLWCFDSFVLRNPPLRKALNR